MTAQTAPSPTSDRRRLRQLERAFAQFNDTSRALESAWSSLQAQVAELTRERDAAQQARLRELAAKERIADSLQALLGALPGAALMIDAGGCVRECNAGARELLGEPLLGAAWSDIAARALRARSEADGTPCLADGRRLGVSRRGTADGGCVLLLTDESEAHARRSGVERQRRLSSLDEMNARLAHQLRTPLATAVLYLSRIADGGLGGAEAQRLGGKALRQLHQLQRLLDDTLAFARGEPGDAEELEVGSLLRAAHTDVAARLHAGAELALDCTAAGVRVRGQRSLLVSALVNLLDNALAVCDRVRLEARADEAGVVLAVQDHGPGIDAALGARIFEPFFTTRADGTGLGLAMARSVVRAHGGELRLVPSERGARFELGLPRVDAHRLLPSELGRAEAPSQGEPA